MAGVTGAIRFTGEPKADWSSIKDAVDTDLSRISGDQDSLRSDVDGLKSKSTVLPVKDLGDRSGVPDFSGTADGSILTWAEIVDGSREQKFAVIMGGKAYQLTATAL